MDLIQQLMKQAGVSQDQAEGGIGLLLNSVKDKLPLGDFSELKNTIPSADQFMSSAPGESDNGGGLMGVLGGMASSLGGGKAGALVSLLGGFSKLGVDADTAKKFIPVVQSFLEGKLGDGPMSAIKKLFA
ncbi:MAG: DUF2780 domain-containing protein [Gammaproteobacteria bacterium]|nr:DUF2780 domain-containing protein [Gammaproteobacteria bacterium]